VDIRAPGFLFKVDGDADNESDVKDGGPEPSFLIHKIRNEM